MVPTPPPTTAEPTPSPITDTPVPQSQYRTFQELTGSGESSGSSSQLPSSECVSRKEASTKKISDSDVALLVKVILSLNHYNKLPWRIIYGRDVSSNELDNIQTIAQEFLSVLRKTTTSNTRTQVIVNKIASRYGGIYKNFLISSDQVDGMDNPNNIILSSNVGVKDLNSIACNFDCTADVSSIVKTNKEIFLCKDYSDNSNLLPSSNQVFNTQYGIVTSKVFNIVLNNPASFNYSYCVSSVFQGISMKNNPGCRALFMEASYTVSLCSELLPPINVNKICNYTSTDQSITNQNIYSISYPITSTDKGLIYVLQNILMYNTYDLLPSKLQNAFSTYIQSDTFNPAWSIIHGILDCMIKRLTVLQEDSPNFIYGHATRVCSNDIVVYGYVQNDLGYSVFLCKDFIPLALFPSSAPPPEVIVNSKFHVLAHELSHTCGTTDAYAEEPQMYGIPLCKSWVSGEMAGIPPHQNLRSSSEVIADCVAFFLDSFHL
jgi:hypothetical protein